MEKSLNPPKQTHIAITADVIICGQFVWEYEGHITGDRIYKYRDQIWGHRDPVKPYDLPELSNLHKVAWIKFVSRHKWRLAGFVDSGITHKYFDKYITLTGGGCQDGFMYWFDRKRLKINDRYYSKAELITVINQYLERNNPRRQLGMFE